MELNTTIIGDCLEVLKTFPEASINCVMTSPPYFNQRDYGVEGQIGKENHFNDYVEKMVNVSREIKRVLTDDGSFWLNLGDKYNGTGDHTKVKPEEMGKRFLSKGGTEDLLTKATNIKSIPRKSLFGIPWRIALRLIDDGWCLRNDVIWYKRNRMPSSCKDRLPNSYEHVFHFVKNPTNYYYNIEHIKQKNAFSLDVIRRAFQDSKDGINPFRKAVEGSVARRGYYARGKWYSSQAEYREELWKERGLDLSYQFSKEKRYSGKYSDVSDPEAYGSPRARNMREQKSIPKDNLRLYTGLVKYRQKVIRKQDNIPGANHDLYAGFNDRWKETQEEKRTKKIQMEEGEAKELAKQIFPTDETQRNEFIKWAMEKGVPESYWTGRLPDDVWDITTKPNPFPHTATYPLDLCYIPIMATCPPKGVVLDPFMGTGTTLIVAKILDRNYIGIDINPEYHEFFNERLKNIEKERQALERYIKKRFGTTDGIPKSVPDLTQSTLDPTLSPGD
jgi:DNA modification methylase